jgi:hypothetical protein
MESCLLTQEFMRMQEGTPVILEIMVGQFVNGGSRMNDLVMNYGAKLVNLPVAERRLNNVSIAMECLSDAELKAYGIMEAFPVSSDNPYGYFASGFSFASYEGLPLLGMEDGEISGRKLDRSFFLPGKRHGVDTVLVEHQDSFSLYDHIEGIHNIGSFIEPGEVVGRVNHNDRRFDPHSHIYMLGKNDDGSPSDRILFGFIPYI